LSVIEIDDYEVYFDDSGTDSRSPVAIAACYVATKVQWGELVRNWNETKEKEGFDFFHMTDFMVNPEKGVKPYCDWDERKKERVYNMLTTFIRIRARYGFALTVVKNDYDDLIPEEMKKHLGKDHYVWAVRCVMGRISEWREYWGMKRPMRYIFSETPKGKGTRGEILDLTDSLRDDPDTTEKYGLVKDGLGFQDMKTSPPLQAADILAWNMLDHHLKVMTVSGKDDVRDCSSRFRCLRENAQVDLGFLTRQQLERFAQRIEKYKQRTGRFPSRRVERLIQKEERRKANTAKKQGIWSRNRGI